MWNATIVAEDLSFILVCPDVFEDKNLFHYTSPVPLLLVRLKWKVFFLFVQSSKKLICIQTKLGSLWSEKKKEWKFCQKLFFPCLVFSPISPHCFLLLFFLPLSRPHSLISRIAFSNKKQRDQLYRGKNRLESHNSIWQNFSKTLTASGYCATTVL